MIEFKELRNVFEGKDIIVLGCGTSVRDFVNKIPEGCITIGVNDIGDIYTPEYLLVVNSPQTFKPYSRAESIFSNKSKYMITHFPEKWPGVNNEIVKIELGNQKLSHINTKEPTNIVDYHNNSPYMACICAYLMGARNIGLIGVDFTDNHFNLNDGQHLLTKKIKDINLKYSALVKALKRNKCNLYNLSPISSLDSIPKMDQDEFIKNANI